MSSASPIRAIHTSLTSRPVPSIPPPTQNYIPLAKHILQHRLVRHVFPSSFLSCWVLSTLWSLHLLGGSGRAGGKEVMGLGETLLTPVRLKTILEATMLWTVLALPEVVLRKTFLTSKPVKAASPKDQVNEARKKGSTKTALWTYVVSALCFLVLHVAVEGDPKLKLFVKSKKHPLYLNPRFIYLFISQLVVAWVYGLRTTLLDRFTFKLPSSLSPNSTHRLLTPSALLNALFTSILLSTLAFPLASLLFFSARLFLPILYRLPFLPHLLKPFTAHFLKMSFFSFSRPISSLHHIIFLPLTYLPLIIRAWSIAYTTIFTWEIASSLFSASISQPITVSHLVPDANLVLVSGISISSSSPAEQDGFPFYHMAYLELCDFASSDSPHASAHRSSFFADQKYTPSLWSRFVRESLLLLGRDYQLLIHRGNPPPPAPTPAPSTATKPAADTTLPFQTTPIKMISQSSSAFRPVQESPVRNVADSLASDGPFAKAVEIVGEEAEVAVSKVPELFRSVRGAVVRQTGGGGASQSTTLVVVTPPASKGGFNAVLAQLNPVVWVDWAREEVNKKVGSVMNEIASFAPGWVKETGTEVQEWWARERKHKIVETAVVNREVDLVVIEVLSHLVCASLTEDKFGVVQRDIPKILEAMVRFLGEIEGWQTQLAASSPSPPPPPLDQNQEQTAGAQFTPAQIREQQELDASKALLSELSDGLKEGIGRIVRTFGDKLTAFKFPPHVARSLQGFLDYCS